MRGASPPLPFALPQDDVAISGGSTYVCILAHTNHVPPNATYWAVLGAVGPVPWTAPAAWLTATAYVAGPPASLVVQGGESYVCLVSHTSGTFATDLAASKWIKIVNKGTGDVVGSGSATDNALVRFDSTTGKLIQNSEITLGDSDGKLTRTAGISISGTNTNDDAASGYVGEYVEASATTGTLTTNTPTNITSITLGTGDWDLNAGYSASGGGNPSVTDIWISINTVTGTNVNTAGQNFRIRGMTLADPVAAGTLGSLRVKLTGSTTYYLNCQAGYTGGTFAVSGKIRARRVR